MLHIVTEDNWTEQYIPEKECERHQRTEIVQLADGAMVGERCLECGAYRPHPHRFYSGIRYASPNGLISQILGPKH